MELKWRHDNFNLPVRTKDRQTGHCKKDNLFSILQQPSTLLILFDKILFHPCIHVQAL